MPLCYPKDKPPLFATGGSDYRKLREKGQVYVDKTLFITEVLSNDVEALIIPRPRRFGKTLNMSTLRYFLEINKKEELSHLFADTAIWQAKDSDGKRYRDEHFQRYPVIFLTFKDAKATTWQETSSDIRKILHRELKRLIARYPDGSEYESFEDVAALLADDVAMSDLKWTLEYLVTWLHDVTGKHVVVLVDEYDAPLHAADQHAYWDEAVAFFGGFLSLGYKDRALLYRGVITGILKVAKENIFSDLNNPAICTILDDESRDAFGFTQTEVEDLVSLAGRGAQLPVIQRWYNGYQFGSGDEQGTITIYNPWSVLQYLNKGKLKPAAYWMNTSANVLVRKLLKGQAARHGDQVEALLRRKCITTRISENLELRRIETTENALWSLLLFSGYLTVDSVLYEGDRKLYRLCVPNQEVLQVYQDTFTELLSDGSGGSITQLLNAMLEGEAHTFQRQLEKVLVTITSYHDFSGEEPEAIYHAFVMGLIAHLSGTHIIRSNREAGHGRADLLVIPKKAGAPAAVLEFKVARLPRRWKKRWNDKDDAIDDLLDQSLEEAIDQLKDRDYAAELADHDVGAVHRFAVAFHKKKCLVERV